MKTKSKVSIILIVCLTLIVLGLLVWLFVLPRFPELGWNLIAEIIGVILTTLALTLTLEKWAKARWKPYANIIKNDLKMHIGLSIAYIEEISGLFRARSLDEMFDIGQKGFRDYMYSIKVNFWKQLLSFKFPDDLDKIRDCFEKCRKVYYKLFKEYEDYLSPECLAILNVLRDLCLSLYHTSVPYGIEEKDRLNKRVGDVITKLEEISMLIKKDMFMRDGL